MKLPTDLLIIIFDEMIKNIIPLLTINKDIHNALKERIRKEHSKYIRKISFIHRIFNTMFIKGPNSFYLTAFHFVETIEECEFLREKYSNEYGSKTFIPRVKYTAGNTYQVAAEIWHRYLEIYDQ